MRSEDQDPLLLRTSGVYSSMKLSCCAQILRKIFMPASAHSIIIDWLEARKNMIRRIGLWGGPSTSKSTLTAWLFSELKTKQIAAEHCQETIKDWTWISRKPEGLDQVFLFAAQLHREDTILRK